MTTNQTIDGVPRESLELALGFLDGYGHEDYQRVIADELRALLDAESAPCAKSQVEAAPQPAPVAVVLPERMEPRDPYDDEANQWNACLDELERLNTKE